MPTRTPSAERFCGEVAANKDALTNPQIIYSDDIEPVLDLYRDIGALAPLGVEDDWDQLVSAYETASTVIVGDQESEQAALTAAYSSEKSAAAIEAWLIANCAVDIGPVFTIVPQGPVTSHRRADRHLDTADRQHASADVGSLTGRVRRSRRDAGSPCRRGRSRGPLRR